MFTGIVECIGKILSVEKEFENIILEIENPLLNELKIDQSVAHNGICLTIFSISENSYKVCAVKETIEKTTIESWQENDIINIERCMQLNGRLDGHIVQGHVDCVATCIQRLDLNNNWNFTFEIDEKFAHLIIEKGSVSVNGTSLTCYNITQNTFEVTIIPYTFENTSIHQVHKGSKVNIEFDVIGKYVARMKFN